MGGSGSKEKAPKAPKGKKGKAAAAEPAPAKSTEEIGSRADSGVDVVSSTSAANSPQAVASSAPVSDAKPKASAPAADKASDLAPKASKAADPSEKKKEAAAAAAPSKSDAPPARSESTAAEDGKLFSAPKGPQRSKIFQALNPEKLWYETRREKEEAKGEVVHIAIRGGGAGMANSAVDFALERDDEGNIIEDHLDFVQEPEEAYDPNNLPDFGELQPELDALRKERAEKQRMHQEDLRRKWMEKKAAEEAARQAELERIAAEEAARDRAKPDMAPDFVSGAQERLQRASEEHYRTFSFKA